MKLRHPRVAVAVAVGVVGLFTFGVVSSAAAATVQFKAFLQTGQATNMLNVTGAQFRARCSSDSDPVLDANNVVAFIRGTASNGITKVDGVNEDDVAYNHDDDDFDTNDRTDLLLDSQDPNNGDNHEVGAQADYMGSGGSPVVNANYASEQDDDPGFAGGANCAVWGAAEFF
jgi:hypothetical protein